MAAVKHERARLLEQLTLIKTDPGKAGGELQEDDILNLRREVGIKKAKLNDLHEVRLQLVCKIQIVLGRQNQQILLLDTQLSQPLNLLKLHKDVSFAQRVYVFLLQSVKIPWGS